MDFRGLILVNQNHEAEEDRPIAASAALVEIAGKTAVDRIAERLRQHGVESTTVVLDGPVVPEVRNRSSILDSPNCINSTRERFWRAAEGAFNELIQDGADVVILVRLGSYAEVDFERLVQSHIDQHARVTQVWAESRPLEIFCISSSRRNDAASLFRSQLKKCRSDCSAFEHYGYVNALQSARDLRQFVIDVLTLVTATGPTGAEYRPGVWMEPGAILERGSRVLAPAFVGAFARVRSGSVITRCSSIEHHAEVDCGTVVENSTLLPFCHLGAGLDLSHSVAGPGRIASLRRDSSVDVQDPKLLTYTPPASVRRFGSAALEFFTYLPRQILKGFPGKRVPEPALHEVLQETSPVLGKTPGYEAPACDPDSAREFPLAAVRRYGHQ